MSKQIRATEPRQGFIAVKKQKRILNWQPWTISRTTQKMQFCYRSWVMQIIFSLPCVTLMCAVRSPQWAARLHFHPLRETVPSGPGILLSTSWLGWLNFGVHRDSRSLSRRLPSILPQKSCLNCFLWTGWHTWGNYTQSLGQISDARCLDRPGRGSTSPERCVSRHGEDCPDVRNEGGWCCREKDGEFQAVERCPSDSVVSKHG